MGSETNSKQLWAVRLLFAIPMLVLLFFTLAILSQPDKITTAIQVYGLFGVLIIIGIVLVLASQITIPWANVEENKADYLIEEMMEQERVFVIPTMCKQCMTTIELNRVRWEDEYAFHCPECQAVIKLRVVEK